MLGGSGMLGNSGDIAAAASGEARESGGSSGGGGELSVVGTSTGGLLSEEERMRIEEGDRNSGGNRWPRQETLALLKIRSDMDVAFRDSSLKGPLWEEVSRKLAELGYNRSAKKCKEKFENVYKYHKRTKDGRVSKPEGKTYRFFDQLEALENQPPLPFLPPARPQTQTHQVTPASPVAVAMPAINLPFASQVTAPTVPLTANPTTTVSQSTVAPIINPTNPFPSNPLPPPIVPAMGNTSNLPQTTANFASMTSSSSTSSDEDPERRRKRKRKWEGYFQRLLRDVIEKQEEMQKRFLETLERRERDRVAREEAWRLQEMARMNREHDLLAQERSMAAAKDAAVINFLQKVSQQQIPNVAPAPIQIQNHPIPPQAAPPPPPPAPQPPVQQPPPPPQPQPQPTTQPVPVQSSNNPRTDNGGENFLPASPSRWPKAEVEALIRLRTNMDLKYQENGPKGPLWEEISAAMCKLGYNRNPKRCKEKWENINKYFKKVKESNKKRPEDSKTCPYFQQLDVLYREKTKTDGNFFNSPKPENPTLAPIMVQPEQQWPLPHEHNRPMEDDLGSDNEDDDDGEDDEDDDDDEASGYEIVTNKPSSVGTAG